MSPQETVMVLLLVSFLALLITVGVAAIAGRTMQWLDRLPPVVSLIIILIVFVALLYFLYYSAVKLVNL